MHVRSNFENINVQIKVYQIPVLNRNKIKQ